MRRSHFAACVAAAMAAAAFAAVPASAASAPRIDVREVPLDKKYSTDQLGLRQQSARALRRTRGRAHPARRDRPPVDRAGRLPGAALPQGLHAARRRLADRGLGRQRPRLPRRRLPDADRVLDADHRRAGRAPDQRVRRQHVPQGDEHLQHASGPRRHQRQSSAPTPTATAASTPAAARRRSR